MPVYWPDNAKTAFGTEILRADHPFDQSDLFTDDGLAHLLDHYPRHLLEIWSFGSDQAGKSPALKGRAPRLPGKDIVDAVKHGDVWLNLQRSNLELPDLKPIADEIYGSLEDTSGRRSRQRDMNLLISSPNVEVSYHIDVPMVALFQVRGHKRLWVYPRDRKFAPPEHVEQLIHMNRDSDLPYRDAFDEEARVFELKPGMGLTWPQLAPHRIRNANCLNVSLSCEFMTLESWVNTNAIYTNAFLRQNLKISPPALNGIGPVSLSKAAFASLHKALQSQDRERASTPITFELDASVENCVKPLWA